MANKTMHRTIWGAAALLIALPLALTACGDETPSQGASTSASSTSTPAPVAYEIGSGSSRVSGKTLDVTLPEGLEKANDKYAAGRILDGVEITANTQDAPLPDNYCALDITYRYAEGGLDRARAKTDDADARSDAERVGSAVGFYPVPADRPLDLTQPLGGQLRPDMMDPAYDGTMLADFSRSTAYVKCTEPGDDPTKSGHSAEVWFKYANTGNDDLAGEMPEIAVAEISVSQDGTVSIAQTRVNGYSASSDGSWAKS